MFPLVAPVLAQVIALSVGARTEARYVTPAVAPDTEHVQEATSGTVGLDADWEHTQLTLAYSPSLLLAHLGSEPRQALIFQTLSFTAAQEVKRARFFVNETAGYGRRQATANALGALAPDAPNTGVNPGNGTGTTGTGTTGTGTTGTATTGTGTTGTGTTGTTGPGVLRQSPQQSSVLVMFLSTTAGALYRESLTDALTANANYSYSGGVDAASRDQLPIFQSLRLTLGWTEQITPTDGLSTALVSQYGWGTDNAKALVETVTTGLQHSFDPRTSGHVGIGVSFSHSTVGNGPTQNNVYPNSDAAITHAETVARGTLALTLGAGFAPIIDPLTVAVDPRLSLFAGVGWSRDRFSVNLAGSTALSLANANRAGSQRSYGATLSTGYAFGQAVSANAGVRSVWQTIEGQTAIPPTYAAFVGLNFGAQTRLAGP